MPGYLATEDLILNSIGGVPRQFGDFGTASLHSVAATLRIHPC
jgi:hypothetical protein